MSARPSKVPFIENDMSRIEFARDKVAQFIGAKRGSTLGQPGSQAPHGCRVSITDARRLVWLIALRQFALWIAKQFRHIERPDSMHDRNQNGTRPPHRS